VCVDIKNKAPWVWHRPRAHAWVHIYLHPGHPEFKIVSKVIGKGGDNTRLIFEATGASGSGARQRTPRNCWTLGGTGPSHAGNFDGHA
jgi:hypothetical protein